MIRVKGLGFRDEGLGFSVRALSRFQDPFRQSKRSRISAPNVFTPRSYLSFNLNFVKGVI